MAANDFGSAEFLFFCRRGFSLDGWKSKDLWADNMKPLFSLSNKKPLTYLPWLKLSGSLPIYPSISNSTTTRISWDFKRRKHKVYASPARWTVFNESSNKTIERRYYQFCRDKVDLSSIYQIWGAKVSKFFRIIRISKFPRWLWKRTIGTVGNNRQTEQCFPLVWKQKLK